MQHFLLIKLREINVFNTNFHRENLHDFPSFSSFFSHAWIELWGKMTFGAPEVFMKIAEMSFDDTELKFKYCAIKSL